MYVPEYEPNFMKTKNWKTEAFKWFQDVDNIDVPVVFSSRDENFKIKINSLDERKKVRVNNTCNIKETIKNEEIRFETDCIGKPHIIKISYFPNWKVEGAEKIYLVSPDFMLVYPEQREVRIYY